MAKNPKRLVAFTFILAAALFEIAAILPVVKGRPINVAFLGVGMVFLVLGLVQVKAAKVGSDTQAT